MPLPMQGRNTIDIAFNLAASRETVLAKLDRKLKLLLKAMPTSEC